MTDETYRREAYRRHLQRRLTDSGVPESLHTGLIEYIAARRPTGHFLRAVLNNDLRGACVRADVVNRVFLFELVSFLLNYAPGTCWGSPQRVDGWLCATEDPPLVFE